MRYCNVAFLKITKMICNIFGTNCRVTGTVQWRVGVIGRGTPSGARTLNFVMVFDQWAVTGDGASSSLTVSIRCLKTVGSPCQNANGLANTYTRTIPAWMSAPTTFFDFPSPVGGRFGVDQVSQYDFNSVFQLVGANQIQLGTNTFRCDSASYLPSIAGGCVFPDVIELFKLSRSDPAVNEAADHILFAQTTPAATFPLAPFKVIPGTPGSGLTLERNFYDMNLRRLNRDTAVRACQLYYPVYPALGQDCDEYPFATTFQGAANGDNYAVRAITASDNQLAGSRLQTDFYGKQRILHDLDRFYVMILD